MSKKRDIEQLQRKAQESLLYAQHSMNPNSMILKNQSKQQVNLPNPPKSVDITKKNQLNELGDTLEIEETKYSAENLITNLKIISNIKPTDKIYLNNNNIIEIDKSLCPSFTRYMYDRSRHLTILFLKKIVNNVLLCTDSILTNEQDELESNTDYNNNTQSNDFTEYNSDILQKFILEISKSFDGLDNLIKTYQNDITIVSEISVLKEKLSTRCVKINNILRIKKTN